MRSKYKQIRICWSACGKTRKLRARIIRAETVTGGRKVVRRAVRTAGRTMSTLAKPYEAQQFEAREAPAAGDPLLRAELEMDRLQKQLQAVKVDKANLQEKVLACTTICRTLFIFLFLASVSYDSIAQWIQHTDLSDFLSESLSVYDYSYIRALARDGRIGAGGGTSKPTETASWAGGTHETTYWGTWVGGIVHSSVWTYCIRTS